MHKETQLRPKKLQIVIQQVDENGRLLSETIYFKEPKSWVQSAF